MSDREEEPSRHLPGPSRPANGGLDTALAPCGNPECRNHRPPDELLSGLCRPCWTVNHEMVRVELSVAQFMDLVFGGPAP